MPRKRKQIDVPETSQEELAKLQQEKDEYEARRDQLKADLFRTEQKITELQSKCGVIRNTSVPILKLPNEITCMIFDYALVLSVRMVEDLTMINGETKWPPGFEVVISHVCHQWRSIALSYPQLWSHFRYDIMHCSLVPSKRFDVYLERSRSMGLELWFNVRSASKIIGDIHKLLKKAVHHFARWRRFTLMADSATLVTSILQPIFQKSASAPMLEHFAICPAIGNNGQEVRKLEAMVFKKGAPNLRSVMLTLSATITCFPPIDNLTTIRLEKDSYCASNVHFSWPVFRNLLSLRSLVNLSIMFDTFRESEFKPEKDQPIEMNSLKHLRIAKFDPFANLLLFIRAPLLESLTIKDIWFSPDFSTSTGKSSGVHYTFPSLKTLCLLAVEAQTPAARYFAKMTANITEITFSNGDYSESFFNAVAARSGAKERAKIWPTLRTINFNIEADSLDELLRLAKSRPKKDVITLRLFDCLEYMPPEDPSTSTTYEQLLKAYRIEIVDSQRNSLTHVRWPPASGPWDVGLFSDLCDPFRITGYAE